MACFFDPYYYFVRLKDYVLYLIIREKRMQERDEMDVKLNKYFSNRRYFLGYLKHLFKTSNLKEIESIAIGFGPLTFWRKKVFSAELSLKVSNILSRLSQNKGLSFLKIFANRWVFCLKTANEI